MEWNHFRIYWVEDKNMKNSIITNAIVENWIGIVNSVKINILESKLM